MIRKLIVRSALVVAAFAALTAAEGRQAHAQFLRGRLFGGGQRVFTGAGGPVALTPGSAVTGPAESLTAAGGTATPLAHYSYYLTPPGATARTYVGYGQSNDFQFLGRPYGRPYDPWTWNSLSGGYESYLTRYYYPPLN